MQKIYLDNAATTPTDPRVVKAMELYFNKIYGNPGSLHQAGREASKVIFQARKTISQIINCKPEEVIFTGSGTESDNLAVLGSARANKKFGRHIITSNIEHHAVLYPFEQLEKEGFKVTFSKVDKDGILILDSFKESIKDDTIFVSIMYANNEIGTIQPIVEIGKIIKEVRADRIKRGVITPIIFHTDACQAAGYLDLDVQKLGVDLLTLNGSKIYGPKGTGVLFIRAGVKIEPMVYGGGQEGGRRSGTENLPGIIGLAEALKISQEKRKKESDREIKLRDYFIKELSKKISKVVVNGHLQKRLPNNVNISILDIEGEAMLLWLDKYGVFVSTGSACDSQSLEPSHVILALGRPYEYANGNLRFTLGRSTTKKDLDYVLKVLPKIVKDLRRISPVNVDVDSTEISSQKSFLGQNISNLKNYGKENK
jgi:cysteine desulfurase